MDAQRAPGSDQRVAALAARQHGIVSVRQLHALGLGRGAIAHRVRSGRLHPLHRGVYAVGHVALSAGGTWMAAVAACGSGAVLSHRSAAAAWRLMKADGALVDVSVPSRGGRRRRPGVRVHRPADLALRDTTRLGALPITTVPRTLLDVAPGLSAGALGRALEQAELLRLLDHVELARLLGRRRAQPGASRLAALLPDRTITRSELEDGFLALLARHRLPAPRTNVRVLGHEVDFLWPEARLVVETDGLAYHRTTQAFERDRPRDAQLTLAGYSVVRFSYGQVTRDGAATAATVHSLLERMT